MLRAYMVDSLTVIFDEGHDSWGEPLAPLEVNMKAYVDWKSHLIRNLAGEQVVSRGIASLIYSRKLTHKDLIYDINGDGIKYAILDVREGKDFSYNHQEIHLA